MFRVNTDHFHNYFIKAIVTELLQAKAQINNNASEALKCAARSGSLELVKLLVKYGAEPYPHGQDEENLPYIIALRNNKDPLVCILIEDCGNSMCVIFRWLSICVRFQHHNKDKPCLY
jgi:ankyrin repeat protein